MNPYVIYTDSACDIVPETLSSWGVSSVSLTFRIDGGETEYTEHDIPSSEFYDKMRAGAVAKTAAINTETFRAAFEAELKQGRDVLYLGFSSGLSATFNSARIAAQGLEQDYPERRVITIDSLCASAGFGLLVFLAVGKRDEGATLDELADYLKATIPSICHWFTVDDLVYLKRGGRISPTVAFVGNLLGIKPVLHVDDEGHLISMTKVRGRRAAIHALAQKYGELLADSAQNVAFISHGDCLQDAELLKSILEKDYGANVTLITPVGTVIGAHSGPGTLALFFLGKHR
ncbi:MAG: DegV family protein [Ruminococcaceae bacterium]|nr:DegV family protein [Oscillospiraceae bacterium]